MDLKRLANTLHSLERKVVPLLNNHTEVSDIIKNSGMQEVEVIRALQWLENKHVLKIETKENKIISLADKAKSYKELPERLVLNNLTQKETTLEDLKKKTRLNDSEINACIGILRKKELINVTKDKILKLSLSDNGKKISSKKTPEEELFSELTHEKINLDSLSNTEIVAFNELRSRGLAVISIVKDKSIKLTDIGKELVKQKFETNILESVTPNIIKNREWTKKNFRAYDIRINVPEINRGKRHFIDQSIEYVKRIWLDMGFKELEGNIVQTAFWDLDALFVPQDHPARDMQDTFFIGSKNAVLKGKVLDELAENVRKVHENGWNTGSKGWGGKWEIEAARDVLLRTHTTVLSAIALSKLKEADLPAKLFTIGKVYRNEALDAKHLFEFYQVEGIVADPNANFRHLIGYLKEFYKKMGFEKIRISPSFFPYTSPSLEISVWNKTKNQWIETGGAGIFRPEVSKVLLGFECPVLAWGQGLERISVDYYKISDLRDVYKNDIKFLREIKEFMK